MDTAFVRTSEETNKMITRPLLAGTIEELNDVRFPVLVTPKLDGIRVLKIGGKILTRKFKELPNGHIRMLLEKHLPDGADGEIMTPGGFNEIQSAVMSRDGAPDFTYFMFDYVKGNLNTPYQDRVREMKAFRRYEYPFGFVVLMPKRIDSVEALLSYEKIILENGYEGVMVRDPNGRYKCGRSTLSEQILLKLKRFKDSEAIVLGFTEKMRNNNEQITDEFGLSKRSHKKEGKIAAGALGSILVRDLESNVLFEIGSGFDDKLKKEIWENRDKYLGKIVKYKYQTVGIKESTLCPRFPVFIGFRNELDMGD